MVPVRLAGRASPQTVQCPERICISRNGQSTSRGSSWIMGYMFGVFSPCVGRASHLLFRLLHLFSRYAESFTVRQMQVCFPLNVQHNARGLGEILSLVPENGSPQNETLLKTYSSNVCHVFGLVCCQGIRSGKLSLLLGISHVHRMTACKVSSRWKIPTKYR